ncbi:MAG: hypothetical protein IJN82_05650, partial [Clostridia bacterium]|nr:hypothetical protein [Clostridia bacterium]
MKKRWAILCGLMLLSLAACSRQEPKDALLSEVAGSETVFEEPVEEEVPRDWSIRYDLSSATLSAPYHEILEKRKSWSWQAPTFEERRALYEQSVYRIEKLGELSEGATVNLKFLIVLDEEYEGSENAFWA